MMEKITDLQGSFTLINGVKMLYFGLSQSDMDSIGALDRNSRIGPDPNDFNF